MEAERGFIDANVILRHLTGDDPKQSPNATALIERAVEGTQPLVTTAMVIAEVVWVLESYYELSASAIKRKVLAILGTPSLEVENRDRVLQAIVWYEEKNVDFIDAFNAAWMKDHEIEVVHTFDERHFDRFEHIRVKVPSK